MKHKRSNGNGLHQECRDIVNRLLASPYVVRGAVFALFHPGFFRQVAALNNAFGNAAGAPMARTDAQVFPARPGGLALTQSDLAGIVGMRVG